MRERRESARGAGGGAPRETALRAALGASTGRLVREALAEGLLIAALGAVCGLVLGRGLLAALLALRPAGLDRLAIARVDGRVLLFACAVAALGGVLFSLAPLGDLLRANLAALFATSDRRVGGQRTIRLRGGLVLSQVALGVVLVIGAGLLVRTFLAMQRVDPGFETDHRLTFRLSVPFGRYRSAAAVNDFSQRFLASVAALPGVTGVGGLSHLPYDDLPNWGGPYLTLPGQDESRAPDADYRAVTSGLFAAIDARVVEGRAFTDADDGSGPAVAIVDDLLASRAWPGQSAVGRTIRIDPGSSGHATAPATVVGVVHHLRLRSVVEDLTEQVFIPERQVLRNPLAYVVRTSGDPAALADRYVAPCTTSIRCCRFTTFGCSIRMRRTHVGGRDSWPRWRSAWRASRCCSPRSASTASSHTASRGGEASSACASRSARVRRRSCGSR